MAHYAFINQDNIVVEVITGRDEYDLVEGIESWEKHYEEFRENLRCIRTSYNGKIRKNFAGIGFTYDEDLDAFIRPKCHDEAVLDEDKCIWICSHVNHETPETLEITTDETLA